LAIIQSGPRLVLFVLSRRTPESANLPPHSPYVRGMMAPRIYRVAATIAGLLVFLSMSCLYVSGDRSLYENVLTAYGIMPFRFPFLDISAWLAVWECAREGIDVISANPCDVLHRAYSASPLWIAASTIPLGVRDTATVGWLLDVVFIMSLSFLPSPRSFHELILMVAATLSTMVIFALERANPDVLLFIMILVAGLLAEGRCFMRVIGYSVALTAALLKYYPVTVLVILFRELVSIFFVVGLLILAVAGLFWAQYHSEIARGLPNVAQGAYNMDLFAAKNLPFLLGEAAGNAAPSGWAPLVQRSIAGGLYGILVGCSIAICRRLVGSGELRAALACLAERERVLLVIGSAVITGCFFAGQSLGYRGVYFLLVIPGLLATSRKSSADVRKLSLGTSVVIVALMWGECARLALYRALEYLVVPEMLAGQLKLLFWLCRELGWWWTIGVMLAVLVDFLQVSPIAFWLSSRFRGGVVIAR
jgi:hypothetical protein